MKKITSIRLFLYLAATVCICIMSFWGSYFLHLLTREEMEEPLSLAAELPDMQEIVETIPIEAPIPPYQFVLLEEDGYVIVYRGDGTTYYDNTAIPIDSLPRKLQEEIKNGKGIGSEEELYNFLESYSS